MYPLLPEYTRSSLVPRYTEFMDASFRGTQMVHNRFGVGCEGVYFSHFSTGNMSQRPAFFAFSFLFFYCSLLCSSYSTSSSRLETGLGVQSNISLIQTSWAVTREQTECMLDRIEVQNTPGPTISSHSPIPSGTAPLTLTVILILTL